MLIEDERKCIEDSKSDPKCFEPLYLKYYEPILKFVYRRIESLDDCREVTSIVFSKALMSIGKYRDQGFPFSSWLFRIAINEVNQFYRDSKKMRVLSIDEQGIRNITEETGTQKAEMLADLKTSFRFISPDDSILLELRYFENRSFSEIGQILKISENNAKIRTYRVLEKLKKIYVKVSDLKTL